MRTAQAPSGPAQNPDSGDGSPVLQSAIAMPQVRIGDLSRADDGRLLIGVSDAGLKQFVGDKIEAYPIRSATNPNALLPDRDVDSNKLLRDRDGGLWIGTHERGLIHVHHGRTDVFTKSDGLSGDIICSLFEDREGNVWVATTRGLDRFRELPVTTISVKTRSVQRLLPTPWWQPQMGASG